MIKSILLDANSRNFSSEKHPRFIAHCLLNTCTHSSRRYFD